MQEPNTRSDVTVVGCGVTGLSTAIRLQEAGFRVRIWTQSLPPGTTSSVAAANWFPYSAFPRDLVLEWAKQTYQVFGEMAHELSTGVRMYECAHLWRESVPDPWWIEAVPDFRRYTEKELPLGYTDSYVFTQPVIEMPVYLDYLMERFYSVGGKVEVRAVASLREAGHGGALVVNCTGLASYDLVKDERLYPIRGQVIRVSNPGIERSLLDSKHPGGSAYVVPRSRDCILGGTSERGNWDTTPDMETAAAIFRRCADVEPKILKAAVLEHKVGLRPGRDQIRLELEELEDGSACIHNYGHGGAGITLSWGCADEVVRLARRDIDAFQDFQDPDSV